MTYEIVKSDGTILVELDSGLTDSISSSITLIGKNVVDYGTYQNANFLHILENFANSTTPNSPLTGQLWFDTTNKSLNVYYNSSWNNLAVISTSAAGASATNSLWLDSLTHQLKINNGSGFSIIGPEVVQGFGATRLISGSLQDTSAVSHPVIKVTIDDEIIAILSADDFDVSYVNAIDGITHIFRGVTLKNYTTGDTQLYGKSQSSQKADQLLNETLTGYLTASSAATGNTLVQRNGSGNTSVKKLIATELNSGSGTLTGNWKFDATITPTQTGTVDLGASNLRLKDVYSQNIDSAAANLTSISSNNIQTNSLSVNNIVDQNGKTINIFDTDATLGSNSDTHLSTQKAIKTYIDTVVAQEVAARLAADQTLQSEISNFGYPITPGTVLYTAGTTVPAGFLAANGALVGKDQYTALYMALGGVNSPYGQNGASFNLPDLRGYFIRGADNGAGVDPGRVAGTYQSDDFGAHNHGMPGDDQLSFASGYDGWTPRSRGNFPYDARSGYGGGAQIWETTDEGGAETRPKNLALLAIIKY
jgi:microcystin-dependent protein